MPKNATKDEVTVLNKQIGDMEVELARLEEERQELDAPARVPSWDELQEVGVLEELAAQERRRGVLPRVVAAGRAKLEELRIRREEAELEPLRAEQEAAYAGVQEAQERAYKAEEERVSALHRWHEAHGAIENREQRIKRTTRELAELREGRG